MAIDRSPRPKARKSKSGQADLAGATQLCMSCMKRKPIQGFDKERLICAECSGAATKAKPVSKKNSKAGSAHRRLELIPEPAVIMKRRCPTCLRKVSVDPVDEVLENHANGRGQACRGSGHALPQRSQDALDHRVPGSFEGGRQ
jgi:hypothetical protein